MTAVSTLSPAQPPMPDMRAALPDAAKATLAQEFEAVFLAEMLRAAGAGEAASIFGGGVGEDQFSSFLINEYARKMAARGGMGIAEMVLRGMDQTPKTDT